MWKELFRRGGYGEPVSIIFGGLLNERRRERILSNAREMV